MMDTEDFARVLNQLRVKLLGASDSGIKAELYDVLSTFFGDSSSWTENLSLITVQDQLNYDLVPTEEGQIIRLAGVVDANSLPVAALMPTVGVLSLRNRPNAGQTLTVTVVKNVALPNAPSLVPVAPEWVLKLYAPYIIAGVLGQMQMQSNASWTDPRAGALNTNKFRTGIAAARSDTLRRNTIGAQAWAFPQSARMKTQRGGVSTGNDQRF